MKPSKPPLFSIVIPTYNRLNDLKFALKSIEAQTFGNFEIIIVDNHSTDGTEEFLKGYKTPVKFIPIHNNGIIGKSRNTGIQHAVGEYVCFLDSDDYWTPKKLEVCAQYVKEFPKAVGFCHGELHENKTTGRSIPVKYGPYQKNLLDDLIFRGNRISTSAAVIKRECLISPALFSEKTEQVTCEDYYLWIQLAKKGEILYIDQILGTYVLHDLNASNFSTVNIRSTVNVFREAAWQNIMTEPSLTRKMAKMLLAAKRLAILIVIYLQKRVQMIKCK